jgi:hypothetical protein
MSDDPSPIRILAVDDHPLIRTGIATLVGSESDMKLVGQSSNGREAITKFRECLPDVTLMDLQMPELNGIDDRHSRGVSGSENHRPDDLRRRRAGDPRPEGRRAGLRVEEPGA